MGGFLLGLGQGLNNVQKSLSDFMEMQRQAKLDQQAKLMQQAQIKHLGVQTDLGQEQLDTAKEDGRLTKYLFDKMGLPQSGLPGQVGQQAGPPQIPSLGPAAAPGQSAAPPQAPKAPEVPSLDLDPNDPLLRMAFERAKINPNQVLGPMTETKPPSATIARAVAAVDSAMGPMANLEQLTAAHNPEDPSGEHASGLHLAGDWLKQQYQGAKYKLGFPVPKEGGLTPDDEQVRQLTNFVSVMAANPLMQGSRNFQMMKLVLAHLPDANGTPEAQHQRIVTAMNLLPEVKRDLLNSGRPFGQQIKDMNNSSGPMQTQGAVNLDPSKAMANMPKPASAPIQPSPAPQAGPAVQQPNKGPAGQVMSQQRFEIYKRMSPGFSDDQLKAKLAASGITVQ